MARGVARENGHALRDQALAWFMAHPGISTTIICASKLTQLASNIAASEITMAKEQMARLNEVSALAPSFSAGLTSPMIRRMVFGGNDVSGWGSRR